jgi:hypothetical protein
MHAGGPSILADISNVASEAYNDHFNLVCMCRDTNAQDRIDSRKTADRRWFARCHRHMEVMIFTGLSMRRHAGR